MKKLSFILAIIMILTCMPIIAITSVSAASLTVPAGTSIADKNAAIGYVENGSNDIYVNSLANASKIASANLGTQVVLYLTKNYETTNRIGFKGNDTNSYDPSIDVTNGANLVIDGQNKYHMRSSYANRSIHFHSGTGKGEITFRNMTIGTLANSNGTHPNGSIQANIDSLAKLTFKNVTFDFPNPNETHNAFVIAVNVEFDGVTRSCAGGDFLYYFGQNKRDLNVTIKNSTITNARNVIHGRTYSSKNIVIDNLKLENVTGDILWDAKVDNLTINNLNVTGGLDYLIVQVTAKQVDINCSKSIAYKNDAICYLTAEKLNVYNLSVVSATNVIRNCTIDKINIYDLNVTSCDRLSDNLSGDITIHNANVTSTKANTNNFYGNMVINGGTFTTTADNVIHLHNANSSTVTINGGTFTATNSGYTTITVSMDADGHKKLTINGGTFNSWNKNVSITNSNVESSEAPFVRYGVLSTTADAFEVNGGTFNLYSDGGQTLSKLGSCVISRGGGYVSLNGGTFNGGQYVYFRQKNTEAFAQCTKLEMPQGNTYKIASSLTTTKGASVRTSSTEADTGIRFQGTVTKDVVDYVKAISGSANVYYGIAILPADYVEDAYGIFSLSELSSANFGQATVQKSANNVNGSLTFTLALTGIKNVDRKFVARTYVYGDLNGNGIIEFSDIVVYGSECSYARSAKETAQAALADVMMVSGTYGGRKYNTATTAYCLRTDSGEYVNMTTGTRYSAFTTDQIAVLKKYAGIA